LFSPNGKATFWPTQIPNVNTNIMKINFGSKFDNHLPKFLFAFGSGGFIYF